MIDRGQAWGVPTPGPADLAVGGDDADLAATVRTHPGALIALRGFRGELARTLGVHASSSARSSGASEPSTALPMDALADADGHIVAVNTAVVGVAPSRVRRWTRRRHVTVDLDGRRWFDGRATTVVVAIGQYLDGDDIAPRGHPGDGRAEVQVYAVAPGERRAMRRRLVSGAHVPHPEIHQKQGSRIRIATRHPVPITLDGHAAASRLTVELVVMAGAYRVVI